jgi:hypothetical protein
VEESRNESIICDFSVSSTTAPLDVKPVEISSIEAAKSFDADVKNPDPIVPNANSDLIQIP